MSHETDQTKDAFILAKRVGKDAFVQALKCRRQEFVSAIVLYVLNETPDDKAKQVIKTGETIAALEHGVDEIDALLKKLK